MRAKLLFPISVALALSDFALGSDIVKNADFSQGKSHWEGSGSVVELDSTGNPILLKSGTSNPLPNSHPQAMRTGNGVQHALEIHLSKSQITGIHQRVILPPGAHKLSVTAQLKASADFKTHPTPSINAGAMFGAINPGFFNALLKNPGDCLVGVFSKSSGSSSSPNLVPGGDWTSIDAGHGDIHSSERQYIIAFPAGIGTVWIKSVTAEAAP